MPNPQVQLDQLIRANYPVIVVNSYEEVRVTKAVRGVVEAQKFERGGRKTSKQLFEWTVSEGLRQTLGETLDIPPADETRDPTAALVAIKSWGQSDGGDEPKVTASPCVFLFKDVHGFLQDPVVIRNLRDVVALFQSNPNTLILLSPNFPVPDDLQKDVAVMDWPLPDREELAEIVKRAEAKLSSRVKVALEGGVRERIIRALMGLSAFEARSVLAMAVVANGALDESAIPIILAEKKAIIKKSGYLEFIEPDVTINDVGGLDVLKDYTAEALSSFSAEAEAYGLDKPKGVFVFGVPGSGKSLMAKVCSRGRVAILRLDLSSLKGGLVGQTEGNTLAALRVIDACGEVIVWMDEIEKALGDVTGRSLDGGASLGQFGILLTWMQERRGASYVFATANRVEGLPPEFLRRFDDVFFVDLPSYEERLDILAVHLGKRRRQPEAYDLPRLAQKLDGFTGAEIEKVVVTALRRAFNDGPRDLTYEDLLHAAGSVIPIAVTKEDEIKAMRKWAVKRARFASRKASAPLVEADDDVGVNVEI